MILPIDCNMILQYLLLSIAIFAIYIAEAYNIAVNIAVLTYIAVNIGTSPQEQYNTNRFF